MRPALLALSIVALLGWSCGEPSEASPKPEGPAAESPQADPAASSHVHDVICGCAVKEIGHCGNYVKIDDRYLEIAGDLGLGKMEFCGKQGLRAELPGEVQGDKYVATSFKLVDAK